MTDATQVVEIVEWVRTSVNLRRSTADLLRNHFQTQFDLWPDWSVPSSYTIVSKGFTGWATIDGVRFCVAPKVGLNVAVHMLNEVVMGGGNPPVLSDSIIQHAGGSLGAALGEWFATVTRPVLERQVLRRYRSFSETRLAVRGRVDVVSTLRLPPARPELACVFDEFTVDVTENRMLRAACRYLAAQAGLPQSTQGKLRRIDSLLVDADWKAPPQFERRTVRLDRLSGAYESPLRLADWVLTGASPEFGDGPIRGNFQQFLLSMHQVFERYVASRLAVALVGSGCNVEAQRQYPLALNGPLLDIQPDIVVTSSADEHVVLDTKYKAFDQSYNPAEADVYQLIAYMTRVGARRGYLVYPAKTASSEPRSYELAGSGLRLGLFPVLLGQGIEGLEGSLASLCRAVQGAAA